MRPLLFALVLLVAGCDTLRVGEPEPGEAPAPPPAPAADPGDAPCETLTRTACLRSVLCTLVAPDGAAPRRYRCRPARGNCEIGLTQTSADAHRCDDRDGCTWAPGACYCACRGVGQTAVPDGPEAEACDCECGGGPPPRCAASAAR